MVRKALQQGFQCVVGPQLLFVLGIHPAQSKPHQGFFRIILGPVGFDPIVVDRLCFFQIAYFVSVNSPQSDAAFAELGTNRIASAFGLGHLGDVGFGIVALFARRFGRFQAVGILFIGVGR
jgi:hypothetical protein